MSQKGKKMWHIRIGSRFEHGLEDSIHRLVIGLSLRENRVVAETCYAVLLATSEQYPVLH